LLPHETDEEQEQAVDETAGPTVIGQPKTTDRPEIAGPWDRCTFFGMLRAMRMLGMGLILSIFVSVGACAGGGPAHSPGPRAASPSADDQVCRRDEDCVLVNDCCGCAMGGTKQAVRADRQAALEAAADDGCAERTCLELASEHRSCSATAARCAGGRCIPAI
jgi:hypothetical protein